MCPIFDDFPYTNYHDLNLDWLIEQISGIDAKIADGVQAALQNQLVRSFNGRTGAVTGVDSFNGATGAVTGVSSFNGQTGAVTGVVSVNGQTGTVVLPTVTGVNSFNGRTGAVTGVDSVNGQTGAVVIPSVTGVNSLNGHAGALTIKMKEFSRAYTGSGWSWSVPNGLRTWAICTTTLNISVPSDGMYDFEYYTLIYPNGATTSSPEMVKVCPVIDGSITNNEISTPDGCDTAMCGFLYGVMENSQMHTFKANLAAGTHTFTIAVLSPEASFGIYLDVSAILVKVRGLEVSVNV